MSQAASPSQIPAIGIAQTQPIARATSRPQVAWTSVWPLLVVAITITANAGILVCQQVAIRLLAPLIGSSIETWSAILGVFLFGIALGNFIACRLADRYSPKFLIASSLILGAVSVYLMPLLTSGLGNSSLFTAAPLPLQIGMAALVVCLLPGVALSLITPPSIRSLVNSAEQAGAISGRIFAWGTLGSLIGNYLTGFVLLALFGIDSIIQATWLALVALAVPTLLFVRPAGLFVAPSEIGQTLPSSVPPNTARELPGTEASSAVSPARVPSATAVEDAGWFWRAVVVVTAASFVSGALEGAAFRILAPLVGVSMFLTAGVVGVVLTGMACGNWIGGLLAQRSGSLRTLRASLVGCWLTVNAVVVLWGLLLDSGLLQSLPMITKVLGWSFSLFFLPALALGTITPQVIGLSVRDVNRTGEITGRLYGFSTLGCIGGILGSAWLMIDGFGSLRTCIACGAVPLLLLWLLTQLQSRSETTFQRGLVFVLTLLSCGLFATYRSPYDRESKYFALKVVDSQIDSRKVRCLKLDYLLHSCIDLSDPTYLFYKHEEIQADLTRAAVLRARAEGHQPRILVIGGGGYTFPRWVEAQPDLQDVIIEVVEIDPAVTEIAHDKLGLSRQTRIVSIHMDGRQYVKNAQAGSYDLVIQDAVNDLSVPYHLMTAEYSTQIRRLLRPERLYLLTLIDNFDSGKLLASAIRTSEQVFGPSRVLLSAKPAPNSRDVFVIASRNQDNRDSANPFFRVEERTSLAATTFEVPSADLQRLLDRCANSSPVLTDNFAPVDSLMAGQFLERNRLPPAAANK